MDGLLTLVERLREALIETSSPHEHAEAAASCLRSAAPSLDELSPEQRSGAPDRYVQHVLHIERDPLFTVLAIVWSANQMTSIHDHLCWGAVAVLQGVENETRYRLEPVGGRPALRVKRTSAYGPGQVCAFAPPADIHQVVSATQGITISLHVYGADIAQLGSSVRTTYPAGLAQL